MRVLRKALFLGGCCFALAVGAAPFANTSAAATSTTAFPAKAAAAFSREEICLNGDAWTFQPVRRPFYGYELDAPGRWKPSQRSHRFIVDALSDPSIDWNRKHSVRVPMPWSCATSEPGSNSASGDFAFPHFWQYVHIGTYERTFSVPASFSGKRIKLAFESVNFRCWVYVNGTFVKGETGASFTHENKHPFEVDITDLVRAPSDSNLLKIVVHDFTASFEGKFPNEDHPLTGCSYPLGDRCDYYNKDRGWRNIDSGIIGDVALAAVPSLNVSEAFVRTSVKRGNIEAEVTLRNESARQRTVRVDARVVEAKTGRPVLEFPKTAEVRIAPGETRTITIAQEWPNPRLWWPHDPFLHRLTFDVSEGTTLLCSHSERFGFREVEMVSSSDIDRRGFYLNGVRVRLFGESVEPTWKDGYSEGVGTSGLYLYNPEYWSLMIDEAKRLNMTVLRPHRGMWVRRMFEIADEKGLLMIAESTINNGNHQGGNGTLANQRRALRDMIRTLRNHPSIAVWSLANESPFVDEWGQEAALHDRTRPYVATQTKPRNHPSPYLSAASGSYALGLSGYKPAIYDLHHANWKEKPMFIYEDNACYDQPSDAERLQAVQQGLTIFRGHRSSGYEIICTFYTWQKLYAQPQAADEKLLRIAWSPAETATRGYRPDFARMPLLDPWSDRNHPRVLRPLSGFTDSPVSFWKNSFSPVAVFDRAYDQRLDVRANPYVAPFEAVRTLNVHNDDLTDRSTSLRIEWRVLASDADFVLSSGTVAIDVPLGGTRQTKIQLDAKGREAVRVSYRAFKSGRERFSETIRLGAPTIARTTPSGKTAAAASQRTTPGVPDTAGTILLFASDSGTETRGYKNQTVPGQLGSSVLVADPVRPDDYVQFVPSITSAGNYHLHLHIPPGLSGTQGVDIRHDTVNTTLLVDLSRSGWIRITTTPLHMQPGEFQNIIRFVRGGTATRSVIDAVKLVPSR